MTIKNTLQNLIGLPILIVTIAFVIYNANDILELFKKLDNKNNNDCKVIRGGHGLEDFAQYDEQYLIGISHENLKLWELEQYGINKTDNGKVFVFDIQTENLQLHQIKGFPSDIAFHPHGIYLYKQAFLYVINHAYKYGGERIEVIKIQKEKDESKIIFVIFIIIKIHFFTYLKHIKII